jgi:hypothetical protein
MEPLRNSDGAIKVLFAGEATSPVHFSTVHGGKFFDKIKQLEFDIILIFNCSY